MAPADKALPYGLRDVKFTPLLADGSGPSGSAIDLPVAQTLSFSETEEFQELRGDDAVQASRGSGPTVEWSLDSGGISLEAYATAAGGAVVVSGVSPNLVKTYTKKTTDSRPYFKIEGQAINDNGGDFHGVIYRAKADGSLEGTMGDQEFWVTSMSGKGYGSLEAGSLDKVYDFIQNETAVTITTDNNEIQMLAIDATGGTFDLVYAGQTAAGLAWNISAAALQTALEALSNIAPGDVSVTQPYAGVYHITFMGTLADTDVAQMTTVSTSLTGGSSDAAVVTIHAGG
jgi:hypothetical protein